MATEELSASIRGIPAGGLQCLRAVRADAVRPGLVRAGVLPAGLGKTVAGKNFEEFSRKPEDALFFPLGCQSRMMD